MKKNEDFFQANQAKDSSASIRRFCFWFCFLNFFHHDMYFSLPRDPARIRYQELKKHPGGYLEAVV
jgi:hypothetical protein